MTINSTLQESLKASTLLFFSLFIGSVFCAILCIDEHKLVQGGFLASYSIVFLLLTIWSNQKRFYPLLIGFFFYAALVVTLVYFFPKIIAEGVGILSPYLYLLLAFLAFLYLIVNDYKIVKQAHAFSKDKKETSVAA